MGDRKHGEKNNETKAVQTKREAEQQTDKKPSEALSRLSANVAQPGDIHALQRTIGNKAVTNLIQRDDPEQSAPSEDSAGSGGVNLGRYNVWTHNLDTDGKQWVPAKDLIESSK